MKGKMQEPGDINLLWGILVSAHMQNWIMGRWKISSEKETSKIPNGLGSDVDVQLFPISLDNTAALNALGSN